MPDVPSNVIWFVGLVVLVCALAFLWNMRLSNHAEPVLPREPETDPHDGESSINLRRFKAMPALAPAPPSVSIVIEDEVAEVEQVPEHLEQSDAVSQADAPDDESAELKLTIAWKLQLVGDFEGCREFAGFVVEDPSASPRQRDRAQAMLRSDNIASNTEVS